MQNLTVLEKRGIIDSATARALKELLQICLDVEAGARVPTRAKIEIESSAPIIIDRLFLLRRSAAQRFETHVINVLRQTSPPDWDVRVDGFLDGDGGYQGDLDSERAVARVDALVRRDHSKVAVEVRSQLVTSRQIEDFQQLMDKLPANLPVLLVLAGTSPSSDWRPPGIRNGSRRVTSLWWDSESDQLIAQVQGLMRSTA